jgi:hypothetical protein
MTGLYAAPIVRENHRILGLVLQHSHHVQTCMFSLIAAYLMVCPLYFGGVLWGPFSTYGPLIRTSYCTRLVASVSSSLTACHPS